MTVLAGASSASAEAEGSASPLNCNLVVLLQDHQMPLGGSRRSSPHINVQMLDYTPNYYAQYA
jgi:hypothetical protein